MKGALITISGSDGAGKATQTKNLVERARAEGYPVDTISFPRYETEFGKRIRAYLDGKYGKLNDLNPYFVARLYAMDRYAARDTIAETLNSGKNLILDRYVTDNLAHQGARHSGQERLELIKWIQDLEYRELGLPRGDLVIFLYLPLSFTMQAIEGRGREKDIHESDINYLKSVEETFLKLNGLEQNFTKINCLDGEKRLSIEEVTAKLWEVVQPKLVK